MEYADGEPSPQPRAPVVLRGHGPGAPPHFMGKHRPQHDKIKMAGVIGKVNTLPPARLRADPAHGWPGQQSRTCGNDPGSKLAAHRASSPRTILIVRRTMVTKEPSTITIKATQSRVPGVSFQLSNSESTQAAVSTAMR